jgi:hypothetical protein
MEKLEAYWFDHPDLRFAQLTELMYGCRVPEGQCVWHLEDDKLEQKLDELIDPGVRRRTFRIQIVDGD